MAPFVWYELMTPDPAAAADFYGKVVGWHAEASAVVDGYTLLKLADREMAGILAPPDDVRDMPARWYGYVAVGDVDAAADRLTAVGGSVFRAPADIPHVGRFAVVADPQGTPFMLFKGDGEAPPELPECTPGTIAWVELHAADRKAAVDFYTGQFGWEKDTVHDSPVGPIQRIRAGTRAVNGVVLTTPMAPLWIYYFSVADIDAATQAIRDNGGSIMHGPTPVPGDAFITLATDPQGAVFELVGKRKG